jgi:MFS family permease
LLAIFIKAEKSTEHPVLDLQLFTTNRSFSFGNLAALLNYSATFAVTFLLSLYLQYIVGMNAQRAGLLMIASPVVQALASPIAGRLSDRGQPHLIAGSGMMLTCLGIIPLMFLSMTTPPSYIVSALFVVGTGLALFSSPNTNAVMSSVDKKNYGVASSTLGTMRLSGQMLSMAIVMMIFSLYLGPSEITPENYPLLLKSMKTGFKAFFLLCVPGIAASFMRNRNLII